MRRLVVTQLLGYPFLALAANGYLMRKHRWARQGDQESTNHESNTNLTGSLLALLRFRVHDSPFFMENRVRGGYLWGAQHPASSPTTTAAVGHDVHAMYEDGASSKRQGWGRLSHSPSWSESQVSAMTKVLAGSGPSARASADWGGLMRNESSSKNVQRLYGPCAARRERGMR
jgi:hypothetical protein